LNTTNTNQQEQTISLNYKRNQLNVIVSKILFLLELLDHGTIYQIMFVFKGTDLKKFKALYVHRYILNIFLSRDSAKDSQHNAT
jgi:hypothetical protein